MEDFLPVRDVRPVADHEGGDIQREQAVPHQEAGDAVGEIAQAEDEDGIEGAARELQPAQDPPAGVTDAEADGRADEHLQEYEAEAGHHQLPDAHGARRLRHQLREDDGEDVGHRVVAAGFQLQHRPQVLPQVQFLAAQDREDGSRIGGAHHGRQQETAGQRHADGNGRVGHQPDEDAGEQDGEQHARGGEQHPLAEDGARFVDGRFKSGREQDDGHREMADVLRELEVVEMDAQHVLAGHHAQQEEQQQGRDAVAGADLRHQDGGEDQDGKQEEQMLRHEVHHKRGRRKDHRFHGSEIDNHGQHVHPVQALIADAVHDGADQVDAEPPDGAVFQARRKVRGGRGGGVEGLPPVAQGELQPVPLADGVQVHGAGGTFGVGIHDDVADGLLERQVDSRGQRGRQVVLLPDPVHESGQEGDLPKIVDQRQTPVRAVRIRDFNHRDAVPCKDTKNSFLPTGIVRKGFFRNLVS